MRTIAAAVLALLSVTSVLSEEHRVSLVVSAPGYPGSTENAQPTMDDFAEAASRVAGWGEGAIRAEYSPTAEEGRERLADPNSGMALLPLPFYLQLAEEMALEPVALVAQNSDGFQSWSLVAGAGSVESASDLAGVEIVSAAGYEPRFVRNVALAHWDELPGDVSIAFDERLLSSLRKAAKGEPVAVLLDESQATALGSLPFAEDLDVVTSSGELPEAVVCVVEGRVSQEDAEAVVAALVQLRERSDVGGTEVLDAMRVDRFFPLDRDALEAARRAFARDE